MEFTNGNYSKNTNEALDYYVQQSQARARKKEPVNLEHNSRFKQASLFNLSCLFTDGNSFPYLSYKQEFYMKERLTRHEHAYKRLTELAEKLIAEKKVVSMHLYCLMTNEKIFNWNKGKIIPPYLELSFVKTSKGATLLKCIGDKNVLELSMQHARYRYEFFKQYAL